ncbi:MAG TPA: NAD(P)-binding protein [Candidatus Nanoarchaeia archaeon]|nr:NAD(P)-binding protein [Candidatus Nanoarchaeia archaeon]
MTKLKKHYLVVDFNPDVIANLSKFKVPCLYGDAYDSELLDGLHLDKVKLIISTIPGLETNKLLVNSIRLVNPNAIVIVRAQKIKEALELYNKGADYVLTPHLLGGLYLSEMITDIKEKTDYEKERIKHIKSLKEMYEKEEGRD